MTANDFTSPVTYRVMAADGSVQTYLVTVTVGGAPPSSAKALTAFSFQSTSPASVGVISEAAHAIAVSVPDGTVCTALVATFTTTGDSVRWAPSCRRAASRPTTSRAQ